MPRRTPKPAAATPLTEPPARLSTTPAAKAAVTRLSGDATAAPTKLAAKETVALTATAKGSVRSAQTAKAAAPKAAPVKTAQKTEQAIKVKALKDAVRKALDPSVAAAPAAKPAKTKQAVAPRRAAPKAVLPKPVTVKAAAPKAAVPTALVAKAVVSKPLVPKPVVPKAVAPKPAAPKAVAPTPAAPKATAPKPAAPKAPAAKRSPMPAKPKAVRGPDGRYLKTAADPALTDNSARPVTVVHLTAELAPIARTGGLGEVVASLAAFQAAAGMNVAIVMPLYRQIREQFPNLERVGDPFVVHVAYRDHGAQLYKLPAAAASEVIAMRGAAAPPAVYFIDNRDFFDRPGIYGDSAGIYGDSARRYAFLSAAAMLVLPRIAPAPAVLHAHDWHTSLALAYLRTWYANSAYHQQVATVLTVHNAAYQGHYTPETMSDVGLPTSLYNFTCFEWYGRMNMLKGGMTFADAVTTVSPTHADELRTADGGFGIHDSFQLKGDRFVGILNGIDQTRWDPATDADITARYSREDLHDKALCRTALQRSLGLDVPNDVPIFVMTARLVQQKGLDLILDNPWLFNADAQWVFVGNGDPRFVNGLRAIAARKPGSVVMDTDFADAKEHRLMAGGDVLLMPCMYEPCGLTQMRAQRYGTVPLVRRVGGLADTVHDGVTGFVFTDFSVASFAEAVARVIVAYRDQAQWTRMMRDGMARDFGWERSEERYRDLYRTVLSAR
jgi:starch synthase